jgi:hypothetical protein
MEESMEKFRYVLVCTKKEADMLANVYKTTSMSIAIGTFLLDLEMLSTKKNLDREVKSEIFRSFLNALRFLFDDNTVNIACECFTRSIAHLKEEIPWAEYGIDEEDIQEIIDRLENFFIGD